MKKEHDPYGDVGRGSHTSLKQEGYQTFLRQELSTIKAVLNRHPWAERMVTVIDITAGPGVNPDDPTQDGSPLIALRELAVKGLQYRAIFCDQRREYLDQLLVNARGFHHPKEKKEVWVCHGDHRETLWQMLLRFVTDKTYGYVYFDYPLEEVEGSIRKLGELFTTFSLRTRFMDCVLYLSSTQFKRFRRAFPDQGRLWFNQIFALFPKEKWLVRDYNSSDPYRSTFLIGTNYAKMRAWNARGFYDSQSLEGQAILESCTFTKEELKEKYHGHYTNGHAGNLRRSYQFVRRGRPEPPPPEQPTLWRK